ncbi:hypothetical protein NR798_22095 [Archangium gephyra]|uniref:TolB family protein n=1 Tax=Archangium gephyra TaxID=48 RepID=UPI0035D3E40D
MRNTWLWLTLLLLSSCQTASPRLWPRQPAGIEQALLSFRVYPRRDPGPLRVDLWAQSLDGRHQWPLTQSGRVAWWSRSNADGPQNGAAISLDGRRVAYAEKDETNRVVGPWSSLFVVDADGTGRREIMKLRQLELPQGMLTRGGSFVWSPDGTRLAFVLESFPESREPGRDCALVSIHVVDVASGRVTPVLVAQRLGYTQLLGWSSERDELLLARACPEEFPMLQPDRHIPVLSSVRVSDGRVSTLPVKRPIASPDGTRVFMVGFSQQWAWRGVYRVEEGWPQEVGQEPGSLPWGVLTWYHRRPGGLLTATPIVNQPSGGECRGSTPGQKQLYRLEIPSGARTLVRRDASRLRVLAFSPDDTHALVEIVLGVSLDPPRHCGPGWRQQLYLVKREELESELPVNALILRSTPLGAPTGWPGELNPRHIGWLNLGRRR